MSSEVSCPPYPLRTATPARQHKMLLELHAWWLPQLPEARAFISKLTEEAYLRLFPDVPYKELLRLFSASSVKVETNFQRYLNVSVESMSMSHEAMRAIRERYDDLLRNYEEDRWETPEAVLFRLKLLQATQFILSVAFLSAELFEAREDAVARQQHAAYIRNLRGAVQELQTHLRIASNDESQGMSPEVPDEWYSAPTDTGEES